MATVQRNAALVRVPRRREICGILALSALGACARVWAQTAATSRPALARFIVTAELLPQSRLWASDFEKFAKNPKHPLRELVLQIQRSNESELLALLVETFQVLTEDDANDLVATLETPLGQWIVQTSLWSRKRALSRTSELTSETQKDLGSPPRRLSNTEMQAIKALGGSPHWQALRRAGNASLLGDELLMGFDWPLIVDLL
jgi:hypothetical protein